MKGRVGALIIIAVLLLIWGMLDFYNYAVTGKEILRYYNEAEIIKRLVNYNLLQGFIKVVSGLLLIAVWHFTGKKEK